MMVMISKPILALATAAFAIGTTEFVIVGLLPNVADNLGVGIPQAGLLVSAYAISVAIGAPFVAVATGRFARRTALLALMAVFILGNVCCALAPNYATLMAARVVTALAHGSFFGIASVVAAGLVPRERRSQAVALIFSGLTLANVLGVPFGTALGQAAGWRATFWVVAGLGVLAAFAIRFAVPQIAATPLANPFVELGVLRERRVLIPMGLSTLASMSLFSVFSYITPILERVGGLAPHQVTWALVLFGIGITAGNLIGGKLADWRLKASVIGTFVALSGILVLFVFTSHSAGASVVTLVVWGAFAFAIASPLQIWVIDAATDAPNMASTLNQGAFNLGNASGAAIGGLAIGAGVAYADLPWIGAGIAVLALATTIATDDSWRKRFGRLAVR